MRTGAIFARGSCRALKWMALLGMVFALGAGEALAQTYTLEAPEALDEGQSLVPVNVTFRVPAEAGRAAATVTVTVSVAQLTDAEVVSSQNATIAVLESMRSPVTRAELGNGVVVDDPDNDTESNFDTGDLSTGSDVEWMTRVVGDVTPSNTDGTATFAFTYGEDADTIEHTAYLRTNRDSADAESELFKLTATDAVEGVTGVADRTRRVVKINDVQTQRYEVDFPGDNDTRIDEGKSAALEVKAVPERTVEIPFNVTLSVDKPDVTDYWFDDDDNESAISQNYDLAAGGRGSFTVNTREDDGDRTDDVVTVTVKTVSQHQEDSQLGSFELTVRDLHKLPKITIAKVQVPDDDDKLQDAEMTAAGNYIIPEGKVGTVTLAANRGRDDDVSINSQGDKDNIPDDEDIEVTLEHLDDATADRRDYTLSSKTVTFSGKAITATFKVDVDADEDVGPESLMLSAKVEGADYGPNPSAEPHETFAIDFSDQTATKITPKSDEMVNAAVMAARTAGDADGNGRWTAGEMLMIEAMELFTYDDAMMNVVLGNIQVTPAGVVSHSTTNDELTVTADGAGTAMVTITGTVLGASSAIPQTTSNVAQVEFSITVDADMIVRKDPMVVQKAVDDAVAAAAAKSRNKIWEPAPYGEVAMVMLGDLFYVPASIEARATYQARPSNNNVDAAISSDNMYVHLTPTSTGTTAVTVTAVDPDVPGSGASVEFDATVVAQAAVRGMPSDAVAGVFKKAGADDLMAQGPAISLDMSELFEVAPNVTPTYSAGSSDADVLMASASGTMLTLTPGQDPAGGMSTVTVTALDRASGANASVEYMATVDALPAMLTVTSDPMDMVEEGGSITLTAMLNQDAASDMIIPVEVTGPATPAETNILLMAGMDEASVMLEADDDYDPMSSWNDIVIVVSHAAIEGGAAVMTLSVTENDSEITYTLMEPEEMNFVEGSEYELTVTAEPAVAMDTEVSIMRDRANSDADADDYTVEPITIMAGETSGSTMLMVTEDNMDDSGHASPEMLTLFGMVGNMQTNSVSVYLWDMAVPALPIIAQLLLAAFLAIGGYRRYLR